MGERSSDIASGAWLKDFYYSTMSSFDDIFNFHDAPITPDAPPPEKTSNEWRKNPKYLAIKRISLSDCINGTGQIEKLKSLFDKPANESAKSRDDNYRSDCGGVVAFGKMKGKTYVWVSENEPNYFSWMVENVDKFRIEANKYVKE